MRDYTLTDTLGTLKAIVALLPFMFAPGYVAGWALNLFDFRKRRLILRSALSVALSIAICPMLSYLLGRYILPALWFFYAGALVGCFYLLTREVLRSKFKVFSLKPPKYTWITAFAVLLWTFLAIASSVDWQIGDRLYPPICAYDHSVRVAMTVALARQIPPENPFFANSGVTLRYHYLWLLFCSLPMRIVKFSARQIVDAGIVWCGIGLMSTIALVLKFLFGVRSRIERKTLLAIALLSVTGLDILPVLYTGFVNDSFLSDMEWWNDAQITSWMGSVLWVPHNVAALIACFVAFTVLRYQAETYDRWGAAPVIIAGLAFASAAGMSVYITFTFVIITALWLLTLFARSHPIEFAMFVSAGVVSLVWALSFLLSFRGPGNGTAFIELTVRSFPLGTSLLLRNGISLVTPAQITVARIVFLPLNYALELGFFLAICIIRLYCVGQGKVVPSAREFAAWTMVATSFFIGTFFRSTTIGSNDLGWRCFLPAQLIFLLWGAMFIHDSLFRALPDEAGHQAKGRQLANPWALRVLALLFLLGVASTGYQLYMLRMFPILVDRGSVHGPSWVLPNRDFGRRAYALRTAYEDLDFRLPPSAVVQANPSSGDPILNMLYSGRDSAAADTGCDTDFGGDPNVCKARVEKIHPFFETPDDKNLDATCRAYGISALVIEDSDPVWRQSSAWIWRRTPLVANDFVRAFACGAQVSSNR
jgi:hypothetical protein